jgi:hypothetical protein
MCERVNIKSQRTNTHHLGPKPQRVVLIAFPNDTRPHDQEMKLNTRLYSPSALP